MNRVVFTDLTLHNVFMATHVWQKCIRECCRPATVVHSVCEKTKQEVNLSVHQDGGHPITGSPEILEIEGSIAEISMSCHHKQIPRSSFCSTTST
jgi:hypothetical protein